jgi:hypothetical protein
LDGSAFHSDEELSHLQQALQSQPLLFFVCQRFRFVWAEGRAGSNVFPLLDFLPALLSLLDGDQQKAELLL